MAHATLLLTVLALSISSTLSLDLKGNPTDADEASKTNSLTESEQGRYGGFIATVVGMYCIAYCLQA